MRAIWKGNISFALVSIPISRYSATRRDELSFHHLHKKDMSPVSYKRFCDTEDVEVPWEDITRGYQYEKDQYVEITDEDLDKADVELTKTIQIQEFVNEDEIDPVYFDKPYYLEPQKGGERAYALMRDALAQSKKVGIAKVAGVSPTVAAAQVPGPARVVALMEILKQSLTETKKGKPSRTATVEEQEPVPAKPSRTRKAR